MDGNDVGNIDTSRVNDTKKRLRKRNVLRAVRGTKRRKPEQRPRNRPQFYCIWLVTVSAESELLSQLGLGGHLLIICYVQDPGHCVERDSTQGADIICSLPSG